MKKQIFLIDDDIDDMKIFVDALKVVSDTFSCTHASNGVNALKMLHYLRPETIFVDYNMPLMNGLEFVEELHKIKELMHIPVFLFSTHISNIMIQKAREFGVAGCIQKPNNISDLILTLKNVLCESKKAQPFYIGK